MGYIERFLSMRYLFNRQRRGLVSVITLISVMGVTVGVAALIIVLSIIEGIDRDIIARTVDVFPHIKIADASGTQLNDPGAVLEALESIPEIAIAEPTIDRRVLLERRGAAAGSIPARLIGADRVGPGTLLDDSEYFTPFYLVTGSKEVPDNSIILSTNLLSKLMVRGPGEPIRVTTSKISRSPLPGGIATAKFGDFAANGEYRSGLTEFDEVTAIISMKSARKLFLMKSGAVDYINIKLHDPFGAVRLKAQLTESLGEAYSISTWEDENQALFGALQLEKLGLVVIQALAIMVACFNIVGTLILLVMQKREEIGILKAIGASDSMIRRTFILTGSRIGLIGTAAGVALGIGFCLMFPLFRGSMPFILASIPIAIDFPTIGLIAVGSLTIALLAALFPAAQAARLNPIDALRFE